MVAALHRWLCVTPIGRHVLALLSVSACSVFWLGLASATGNQQPLLLFLLAVLVSSWLGGWSSGVGATVLSVIAVMMLGMGDGGSAIAANRVLALGSFTLVGLLISGLNERLRLVARRAEAEAAASRLHAEARAATEDRLRGVVQCDMLGIAFWSATGEISEPNDALLRILGYTREDLSRRTLLWNAIAPRAELKRGVRAMIEIRDRGFCAPFETVLVKKDGARVPVLVGGGSFSGRRDAGAFFVLDMTQARSLAEALQASERRYRLVADYMHDIVSLHEPDGRVLFVSPSVRDRLGWEVEQITGHSLYDFVWPEDRARLEQRFGSADEPSDVKSVVWRCQCQDGTWRWLETNATAIVDGATGTGPRLLCTSRDVTERKSLEEQLRQAQRMEAIGRLAGGVAHDFNNLLTVILGYASHLEYSLAQDDSVAIEATEIRGAAERAARLTQQLLAFSRQQVLQPRVVDLNESVRQLTSMLQRLIGAHVRLDVQLQEDLWTVLVDPGQVEQVFMNLVVNARDAMPDGGRITIRTETERLSFPRWEQGVPIPAGDWVVFEVSDCGEGMPPAVVARIFEPFFTTKALGQGTGLGLSTVYGIVKQSGGFVFCHSTLGRGTTMRVYLPRAQANVEESSPAVIAGTARGGTILIVEDEVAVRGLLVAVLQKAGYRVYEATSGPEALAQIAEVAHLDLLITDVIMPDMGGLELARRVVKFRPGTPVLYMSGYADEVLDHDDMVSGASFLQKPFRPDVLLSKVRDIVEGAGVAARA